MRTHSRYAQSFSAKALLMMPNTGRHDLVHTSDSWRQFVQGCVDHARAQPRRRAMKLSYKAWALVFVTVGVFSLLSVIGARWIMASSFTTLETQAAFAEGERASRLVNQQLRGLAAQVRSAAYSADMVSYAA
eukprot:gene30801-53010_t